MARLRSLYSDGRCVEIRRRDGIRYSYLEIDFINVYTDPGIRRRLFEAMEKYLDLVLDQASKLTRKMHRYILSSLEKARIALSRNEDVYIPFTPIIYIGNSYAMIKLPKEVIDDLANEIIELVREWCLQRLG